MPVIIEYFPSAVLALNEEVGNHPLLQSMLLPEMTLEEKLGVVAAYCNVVVDGYLLNEEIETLVYLLLRRLKEMSTITIQ